MGELTALLPAVAAPAGLVVGELLRRRVVRGTHRRADEVALPARHAWWLPVVLAGAEGLAVRGALGGGLFGAELWLVALLLPFLVWLSAIDLDVRRLPDRFTRPLVPVVAGGVAVVTLATGHPAALGRALCAGAVSLAFHWLLAMVSGGAGMGAGDVKLAPSLGMLLGVLSWPHLLFGLLASFVVGLVWGLVLRAVTGARDLPFGPAMVLGCVGLLLVPEVVALAG